MQRSVRTVACAGLCALAVLLVACGSDNNNGAASAPAVVTMRMTGAPAISGLGVRSGGQAVAANGDGSYTVPAGVPVTFYAGNVQLTTVAPKAQMNLFDLVDQRQCQSGPALAKVASLLYALSAGADKSSVVLPAAPASAATVKLADLGEADLLALEQQAAGHSVALNDALLSLNALLDAETWTQAANRDLFESDVPTLETYLGAVVKALPDLSALNQITPQQAALLPAQWRTQGLAYTGNSVVFSWRYGLQSTDMTYAPLVSVPLAVPAEILAQQEEVTQYDPSQRFTPGASHIGDIDYANGKLYAPIEDENVYNLPYIAIFDPVTLKYTGEKHLLPQNLLTEGVPWVAVDPARGLLYTAEWENDKVLNVFDLNTFELVRTVPLQSVTPTLTRIQGAKIYNGMLYASADTKDTADPVLNTKRKRVYRIDPVSGSVTEVLHYDVINHTETEGLAFYPTADGQMHIEVASPYASAFSALYGFNGDDMPTEVSLYHYKLTTPSQRLLMCSAGNT